tara:strand:- start:55 stop:627 length:573 start_codon:yes stop_codon:yes gene_type:complete
MHTLQLFPTHVYAWDWDGDTNIILEQVKNIFKDKKPVDVMQSHPNILNEIDVLSDFINQCLYDVKKQCRLQCEGLKITTSWVNKYQSSAKLQWHRHPMSAFSGVMFLNDCGSLSLADPVHFRSYESTIPFSNVEKNYELQSVPGRVIIFPWWMEHSAESNTSGERWSLAFNSMPYGTINSNLSSAILEVK